MLRCWKARKGRALRHGRAGCKLQPQASLRIAQCCNHVAARKHNYSAVKTNVYFTRFVFVPRACSAVAVHAVFRVVHAACREACSVLHARARFTGDQVNTYRKCGRRDCESRAAQHTCILNALRGDGVNDTST